MKVARDKNAKDRRGLDRFFIIAGAEASAGLVPSKWIRKDDAGQVFATEKAAKAYAKKLQKIIDAGGNPSKTIGRSFGDALDRQYADLDRRQEVGEGSADHYDTVRARLRTHVESFTLRGVPICNVPLNTIDIDLIEQDLLPQIRNNSKFSIPYQRKLLNDVRSVFLHAVDMRWIVSNPTRTLKIRSAKVQSASTPLTRYAYQNVLDNWSNYIAWIKRLQPDAELPIQLAAQTGVRASELTAITPNQIGHNTNQLIVDRAWKRVERRQAKVLGLTKNGTARAVGLSSNLLARLGEHQLANGLAPDETLFGTTEHKAWDRAWRTAQFAVNGWLLIYSGNRVKTYRLIKLSGTETDIDLANLINWSQIGRPYHTKRDDGDTFRTLAEAVAHAGIALLRWHDLRHLYCSVLFKNDESIGRITELLGHSSEAVTRKHYKEWITDPERDAGEAERVAASFG